MAADLRVELENLMNATLADEAKNSDWTYDEVRPMLVPPPPWRPGRQVRGDCSKGVQYICRWTPGVPDPMDENWGPFGNSQTLWSNLQHLDTPEELLVGDFVTFGLDGDEHATMVLKAGADPLLWSFGHQGAPNSYLLSQDGRPAQYLRNPLPAYIPTPQDKLRAKTTWFAWVAWRLGEGDWKPYGKTDTSVRPNVPVSIPAEWWTRYEKFLLNRDKGNPSTTTP